MPGEPLGTAVEKALTAQGLSMAAAARQLGLPPATFRNWIRSNRFPRSEIPRLGAFLGLPTDPDQIEELFGVEWSQERSRSGGVGAPSLPAARGTSRPASGPTRTIRDILVASGPGDILVTVGVDTLPPELTQDGWFVLGDAIRAAAARGLRLLYLWPDQGAAGALRSTWGWEVVPDPDVVVDRVNHLSADLKAHGAQADQAGAVFTGLLPIAAPGQHVRHLVGTRREGRRVETWLCVGECTPDSGLVQPGLRASSHIHAVIAAALTTLSEDARVLKGAAIRDRRTLGLVRQVAKGFLMLCPGAGMLAQVPEGDARRCFTP